MHRRILGMLATVLLLAACAGGDGEVADPPGDAPDDARDEAASPSPRGGTPEAQEAAPATGDPEPTAPEVATGEPEAEGGLVIVSTVAPVADALARVLGDRGRVETLIPAGADSHTYEPRPQDVAVLEAADAFFGVGLGLNDASVRLAEANLPPGAPLVLLGEEALAAGHLVHDHDHGHDHSHDHSHSHDDDGGHGGDGEAAAGANPHVWTSVRNMIRLVNRATVALAELDPDPEAVAAFSTNTRDYVIELQALDVALAEAVESIPKEQRKLVVYHDSWSYFGRDYGMEVVAAVQPSDFSEPSAADVRAIIDQIRAEQVPAVFGSTEFPSDVLAAIAQETGATYVGDLADDTLPGAPGEAEHSYTGMMVQSATAIVEALGGDAAPLGRLAPSG